MWLQASFTYSNIGAHHSFSSIHIKILFKSKTGYNRYKVLHLLFS